MYVHRLAQREADVLRDHSHSLYELLIANHDDKGTLLAETDTQTRKYFTCIWPSFGIQVMNSDSPVTN